MRRAYNHKLTVLDDDNKLIGISFGFDFCAEHEWGIETINREFDIPGLSDDFVGVEARRIREFNPRMFFRKQYGDWHCLLWCAGFDGWFNPAKTYAEEPPRELRPFNSRSEDDIFTAWSERDFGILHKDKDVLDKLYAAFELCDVGLWVSGQSLGSGLVAVILSNLPEETKAEIKAADLRTLRTKKRAAPVEERVNKILKELNEGKEYKSIGFYSMSPKIDSEDKLMFWVNPYQQKENKAGWYTEDQIIDWLVIKRGIGLGS